MSDFATVDDVEAAWRPLTEAEATAAQFWLPVASAHIRAEFPLIDARISAGALNVALVAGVAVSMVRRVIGNPDGAKSVSAQLEDFQRSVTLNDATASGALFLTGEERRMLGGVQSSAFSIRPAL